MRFVWTAANQAIELQYVCFRSKTAFLYVGRGSQGGVYVGCTAINLQHLTYSRTTVHVVPTPFRG